MKGELYENWSRRELFEFFSRVSDPFYSVSFRLDVTRLRAFCKERGLSFYYAMIWLSTKAFNDTPAFSYLLRDGELARLPARRPSFTDLKPGAEQFHIFVLLRHPKGRNKTGGRMQIQLADFLFQGHTAHQVIDITVHL